MIRLSCFLAAGTVVALTACRPAANEQATQDNGPAPTTEAPQPLPPPPPVPAAPLMTTTFEPATGSKVAGEVQILPVEGNATGFRVSVNLRNVPEGEHAWHIHQGACGAKDAPVVVPFTAEKDKPAIASPIVAGADGNVMAEATVPSTLLTVDQLRSGDYSLHVHQKGGTAHGPSIACAAL
jgi:Cu/Zn superoxide dismutase